LRFAAKLNFRIATESERAICDCANLLADIPPARLYDETLKLFMGGHGLKSYAILKRYRLLEFICPETAACLEDDDIGGTAERFVMQALENTDTRIADGKPVTPAFLFAALLWEPVVRDTQAYVAQGIGEQAAIESAGVDVIARQIEHVSLPRRFALVAREIWGFQPRLLQRRGQRTAQLLSRPRFRAAYDFLLLRAQAGENDVQDYADWWTQFQAAGESERQDLLTQPAPAQESRGTESKASAGAPRTARGGRSGRGKGRRTEAKQGRPPKEKSQASRGQSKGQAKGAGKANANGKPKTRDAAAGQSSAEKAEKSPKAAKADGRTEAASADGARKRRRRRRPRRPAESAAAAQ
ncbi:MAG: hypothetical protein KDK91_31130, partial [Gammaproteobacteria bacterium]|nr:hypothetical protein [Gammaproteobacteria bacterium]